MVMKTGTHPMRTRLRLFLERGIIFGEPYQMPERVARKVAYAGKRQLTYHKEKAWDYSAHKSVQGPERL